MKEQIYTIPVNDAFGEDCECPMCKLEKDLEDSSLAFILSPSIMEPDNRVDTNEKGFCRRHFAMLYNRKENVLGVSLLLETHIQKQTADFEAILKKSAGGLDSEAKMNNVKSMAAGLTKRPTSSSKFIDAASAFLEDLEESCVVCERMTRIMDRYADVVLWMYFKDPDFRKHIIEGKGFCLPHYKLLLLSAKKYLSPKNRAVFVSELNALMIENMDRILKDVRRFSQKFDYRNKSVPWGTAKDAVPRAIGKITSFSDVK